jgi:hypothetical protein
MNLKIALLLSIAMQPIALAGDVLRPPASAPSQRPALSVPPLAWPEMTRDARPWSYWWWLGSAVDATNITRELTRYRDAGWGGVHIIPIYGAKGWEDRYLDYLSSEWMAMLRHTVEEANRLGLGVDMTTGSGWCFGGPSVTESEANAAVIPRNFEVTAGDRPDLGLDSSGLQALMAFGPAGQAVDLKDLVLADGAIDWVAPADDWRVIAVGQQPSGRRVKRAAPGGAGHMLNLFHEPAMENYLRVFSAAFDAYEGPLPRSMYHDSYEYISNWSPDLFEQFARRRGYRLENELPALFNSDSSEHAARVQCDFRETLSDMLVEEALPRWVEWCHARGMLTRNQAHGSPGNLLDLYALADIPETEMFHTDRNRLVSKLASSAAHVTGRRLVAAETGTWLKEHFTETLADMKYLLDDLFLSGVNHVVYHGTCYSPDKVPWPGWLFYASYEMNPRNPIWHDVPALNQYVARCQSVLQSGQPDADVLLYWPIHEFWQRTGPLERKFTVHAREWLEAQPFGQVAEQLWQRGYDFDYISDRQLQEAEVAGDNLHVSGAGYRTVVVPNCRVIPVATFRQLLSLARGGATIIFESAVPQDVPGWGRLDDRRAELRMLREDLGHSDGPEPGLRPAVIGRGRVLVGEIESAMATAGVGRESLVDQEGLFFLRRRFDGGWHYFVANRGEEEFVGWLPLVRPGRAVIVMDPMTGRVGCGKWRDGATGRPNSVFLRLLPGESLILRVLEAAPDNPGPDWTIHEPAREASSIDGPWMVQFLQGGPERPARIVTDRLASWTDLGDVEARRFAGTAVYSTRFNVPEGARTRWFLDLGDVRQSARVRLNGRDLGTCLIPPFRVVVEDLKPTGNELEIEVTNVAANRIRDLDRRKVAWRTFHDINFVNLDYQPFDASEWPLTPSGLLGPVRLIPLTSRPAP